MWEAAAYSPPMTFRLLHTAAAACLLAALASCMPSHTDAQALAIVGPIAPMATCTRWDEP